MTKETIVYTGQANALKEKIEEKMSTVFDPELGLDVVNLGLIYEVKLDVRGNCEITLTYTSMGCTCSVEINQGLEEELVKLEEISAVDINVVWSPKWDLSRITRYGRIALGINPRSRS